MNKRLLSQETKTTLVKTAVAAGTTDIETDSVDMSGFDSVLFIAVFGTLTATQVTSMHAEQSADDSTFNDLEDSGSAALADDDDDKIIQLDIHKPGDRYVRAVIDRGTANAVLNAVVAIQYNAKSVPTTQDADTVVETVQIIDPDEGTI